MQKNVASQKLIVFAFDSTTNLPKSGDAANLTAYVSKDYGSVTVLGDTSATEMDATNAKGYYLFDLTQGETNADTLCFTAKSSTSNIVVIGVPAVVFTTAPNFSLISIDGSGRLDIIKINGTSQTARDIGASVLLSSGTGTGQVSISSGVVQADAAKINGVSTSSVTTINANQGTTQPLNFTGTSSSALVKSDTVDIAGSAVSTTSAQIGVNVVQVNAVAASSVTTINANLGTTQPVNFTGTGASALAKSDTVDIAGSAVSTSSAQIGVNVVSYASGQAPLQPTVAGRTLDVSAGGEAGLDWANIGSPTTTVNLSGTTIKAVTDAVTFGAAAVWDYLTSSITTAGSIGKLIVDNLNATITSRMATYTQPTGFLAATFPTTVASTTNITAGTITTVSGNVTGNVGGNVTGSVGSVVGNVGGNVTGTVASVVGNVGGNVVGSVASVTGNVGGNLLGTLTTTERNAIADAALVRDWTSVGTAAARSTLNALRFLRNKWSISAGTLTVTKEDDSTTAWTGAVTTTAGNPLSEIDPT